MEAPFPGQAACLWVCGWETSLPGLTLERPHGPNAEDPRGLTVCGHTAALSSRALQGVGGLWLPRGPELLTWVCWVHARGSQPPPDPLR